MERDGQWVKYRKDLGILCMKQKTFAEDAAGNQERK